MPSEAILAGSYDYRLVALSLLIATLASYTALDLGARVTASRGRLHFVWLTGGAIAMGMGIWSMHYIGMLAYNLPVPVSYDWPTVLWYLLAAIGAAGEEHGAAINRHWRLTDGNRHRGDALHRHGSHAATGYVSLFSRNRVPVGHSRDSDFACSAVVDIPLTGRD